MSVLVFITDAYPLGGITEQAFIKPEIEPLASVFDRVILMPVNTNLLATESKAMKPQSLPANVTVSHTLLSRPSAMNKASSIFHPNNLGALMADARHLPGLSALRHLMAFSAYVLHYRRKLLRWIKENRIDPGDTLFYTFWFEAATAALATIPGLKIVTRAHGHDIYNLTPDFISPYWRRLSLDRILGVRTASETGADYLRKHFPGYAGKIECRYLGSPTPLSPNPPAASADTPLVLLSCSRLAEGKGVELQISLIKEWARRNPARRIHWLCIGSGPLEETIKSLTSNLPPNLTTEMTGWMSNEDVHRLLSGRHIDVSLLLSESEGLPIAMVEALSYGIPIITTPVGGLSEITAQSGGLLLDDNPSAEKFCSEMDRFVAGLQPRRQKAREFWSNNFDADALRKDWAHELASELVQ